MHATLLTTLLVLASADAPAPAPGETPAAAPAAPSPDAAPAKEEPGMVEQALNRIPPVFWDKDASFNERLGKTASAVMVVVGLGAIVLAAAGVGLTAAMQKSPWPKDSDYRQQPRSTFIMAAMAITAGLAIAGVVCTLGGFFALFVA